MAFIEWKSDLSVGVAAMDVQHQKLIALINQLAEAMKAGKGNTVIETVLENLLSYTKTHFASEEQLLLTYNYPAFSTQQIEHGRFTKKILDFQSQSRAGRLVVSIEVLNFLRDWLVNHIQVRDKHYGKYLNNTGVH